MGWRVGTTADAPSLWHGGALPHYRGAMAFSPSARWGVVVLSNLGAQAVDHTRGITKGVTARLNTLLAARRLRVVVASAVRESDKQLEPLPRRIKNPRRHGKPVEEE